MGSITNGNHGKGNTFLFTSESVGEGHPDKIASVILLLLFEGTVTDNHYSDQVSDAILDACLKEDPLSKVSSENLAGEADDDQCSSCRLRVKLLPRPVSTMPFREYFSVPDPEQV